MTLSKKNKAKLNFLNSSEGRALRISMERHNIPLDQISDTMLPDDFEFEGRKVVDGQFCKTVGEYKKALRKYQGVNYE